jgi:hypothetical protein
MWDENARVEKPGQSLAEAELARECSYNWCMIGVISGDG